jgi:hypothetical protein
MPNAQHPTPSAQRPTPTTLLLDGVAVIWLVVIAAQYALVMLLPGAPDMSASYPALLAGIVIAGIMRYLLRKGS